MGVNGAGRNAGAMTCWPVINEFCHAAIHLVTYSLVLALSEPVGSLDDGSVRAA